MVIHLVCLIEMAAKMFEQLQGPNPWGLYNEVYARNLEIIAS